jgi:tetratricopeptide (TPR) repeat protein
LTDHRIKRDASQQENPTAFSVSDIPLIVYSSDGLAPDEVDRDLGIALSRFAARQAPASPFRKEALGNSKTKLTESLKRWPDDSDAWLAMSEVEKMNGNMQQALNAAEKGLLTSPNNESLLAQIATVSDATGKPERALLALNALVALVPTSHDYRTKRMLTSVSMGDWDQAEQDCNELLRINPTNPTAHLVLGMSLYGNGKQSEGREELANALILASTPQQRASIQSWFDRFVAWRSQFE